MERKSDFQHPVATTSKEERIPNHLNQRQTAFKKILNAVKTGNFSIVNRILHKNPNHVNLFFNDVLPNGVYGPVILIAIMNGNIQMIENLVKDHGAKLDATIYINGLPTTILGFALNSPVKNRISVLRTLISLNADISQIGSIFDEGEIFTGCPLEIATFLSNKYNTDESKEAVKILTEASEASYQRKTLKELHKSAENEKQFALAQIHCLKLKMKALSVRLIEGEEIQKKINELKAHPDYLTYEEMCRKTEPLNHALAKHQDLANKIENLMLQSSYIPEECLDLYEKKLGAFKCIYSFPENVLSFLECVECTSSAPARKNFYVCPEENHLLCDLCCEKLDKCPVCNVDFRIHSPRSCKLAEKIITRFQTATKVLTEAIETVATSDGLGKEVASGLKSLQDQFASTRDEIRDLESNIGSARKIDSEIRYIRMSSDFLTPEGSAYIRMNKNTLNKAVEVQKAIDALKTHHNYISEDEIDDLRSNIRELELFTNNCEKYLQG